MRHRNVRVVGKASRLPALMRLLAAWVFVTASAVCDTSASTETGSCNASNKGTVAEEIAFVQVTSELRAAVQRNGLEVDLGQDDRHRPVATLPPLMPLLKAMVSDMVQNVSGQVIAQKDALCNSIRGEVTDPLALWLRGIMKSCTDATGIMVLGANQAGKIAANAVNESIGEGDIDYVLKQLDLLLGETAQNMTKRMASFAIQVENLRVNFSQTMYHMGLNGLADSVSDARLNQTLDAVLDTLKTVEEASVGLGNNSVPTAQKVIATCRENLGKWVFAIKTLTTVAESSLQGLVMSLQGRLLPIIDRAPIQCRGALPSAILDANQTVTTTTEDLRQANTKFHIGIKKALVYLTEALEKQAKTIAAGNAKSGAPKNKSNSSASKNSSNESSL